jgi:hypothetical protein
MVPPQRAQEIMNDFERLRQENAQLRAQLRRQQQRQQQRQPRQQRQQPREWNPVLQPNEF